MLKLRYYILRLLGRLPKWYDTPVPTTDIIFQDDFKNLDKWKFTIPWYTYETIATIGKLPIKIFSGERDKQMMSIPGSEVRKSNVKITNSKVTILKGDLYVENIPPCCRIQIKAKTKNLRNYIFLTAHKWKSEEVAVHISQDATSFKKFPNEEWNIYEIELTEKCVKWYLNGLLVKTTKKYLPTEHYYFILSAHNINAIWLWSSPPSREFDIMECYADNPIEIDWVKVYEI